MYFNKKTALQKIWCWKHFWKQQERYRSGIRNKMFYSENFPQNMFLTSWNTRINLVLWKYLENPIFIESFFFLFLIAIRIFIFIFLYPFLFPFPCFPISSIFSIPAYIWILIHIPFLNSNHILFLFKIILIPIHISFLFLFRFPYIPFLFLFLCVFLYVPIHITNSYSCANFCSYSYSNFHFFYIFILI